MLYRLYTGTGRISTQHTVVLTDNPQGNES